MSESITIAVLAAAASGPVALVAYFVSAEARWRRWRRENFS